MFSSLETQIFRCVCRSCCCRSGLSLRQVLLQVHGLVPFGRTRSEKIEPKDVDKIHHSLIKITIHCHFTQSQHWTKRAEAKQGKGWIFQSMKKMNKISSAVNIFPAESSQPNEQALTWHIQRERELLGGKKSTDSLHLQRVPSTGRGQCQWALPLI